MATPSMVDKLKVLPTDRLNKLVTYIVEVIEETDCLKGVNL